MSVDQQTDDALEVTVRRGCGIGLGGTGGLMSRWFEYYCDQICGESPPFLVHQRFDSDAPESVDELKEYTDNYFSLFEGVNLGDSLRYFFSHRGTHPHFEFLRDTKLDGAQLERGCQGVPRLGRALYLEQRSAIEQQVRARLRRLGNLKASEYKTDNTLRRGLRYRVELKASTVIHVFGSVCGGTAAGMLIDFAYDLRAWANQVLGHTEIVAHLLLPDAFNLQPAQQMKLRANGSVTLKELELLNDSRRGDIRVRHNNNKLATYHSKVKPFDYIFLLDANNLAGSTRDEVARLAGRVAAAMALEPGGQEVFSKANNEQTDSLSRVDTRTGRLRGFATYGLACGTAPLAPDVNGKVLAALGTRLKPDPARAEQFMEPAREAVKRLVAERSTNLEDGVTKLVVPWYDGPKFAEFFRDQVIVPDQSGNRESPAKAVLAQVARVAGIAEDAAEGRDPLLEAAAAMRQGVFDEAEPDPAQVRAIDEAFARMLGETLDRPAFARGVLNAALTRLATDGAARIGEHASQNLHTYRHDAFQHDCRRLIGEHWAAVTGAALHELLRERFAASKRRFDDRLARFKELVLQAERLAKEVAGASDARAAAAGPRTDHFSEPLTAQATASLDGRDVARGVIRPILEAAVFAAKPLESHEVRQVILRHTAQACEAVQRLRAAADGEGTRRFTEALAGRPQDHPFFGAVQNLLALAEPKIRIATEKNLDKPSEMIICQCVRKSVIPALVSHHVGFTPQSADVGPKYQSATNNWVLFFRLKYGFSLPALQNFEEYEKAEEEYGLTMGFKVEHLWRDSRWYDRFVTGVKRWEQEQQRTWDESVDHRVRSKFLGRLRETLRECVEYMIETCHTMPAPDMGDAYQAAYGLQDQVNPLIQHLTPGPSGVVATATRAIELVLEGLRDFASRDPEGAAKADKLTAELEDLRNELAAVFAVRAPGSRPPPAGNGEWGPSPFRAAEPRHHGQQHQQRPHRHPREAPQEAPRRPGAAAVAARPDGGRSNPWSYFTVACLLAVRTVEAMLRDPSTDEARKVRLRSLLDELNATAADAAHAADAAESAANGGTDGSAGSRSLAAFFRQLAPVAQAVGDAALVKAVNDMAALAGVDLDDAADA